MLRMNLPTIVIATEKFRVYAVYANAKQVDEHIISCVFGKGNPLHVWLWRQA